MVCEENVPQTPQKLVKLEPPSNDDGVTLVSIPLAFVKYRFPEMSSQSCVLLRVLQFKTA